MPANSPREPHLFRFGLRQLFLAITLLSVLCALLVLTKGAWPLVIGISALLLAGHLFGTLIGTRLRDTSHEVRHWKAGQPRFLDDGPRAELQPGASARASLPPRTPLANRGHTNHWLLWFLVGGAMLGMLVGGPLLGLTIGSRIGWPGLVVGTVSCGVLGIWTAFLASCFSSIARHAWKHAHQEGK